MLKFNPKAAVFQSVLFKGKSSHRALPYKWTENLAFLSTYYLPSEVELRTQDSSSPEGGHVEGTTLEAEKSDDPHLHSGPPSLRA